MQFDDRDRAILRHLQQDGRLTNAELSERAGMSPSACLRRVRMLEEEGAIDHYSAVLNEVVMGLAGVAFILVTLNQQGRASLDRFEASVGRHPEILECYLIAGAADYLIRVAYADAADFERIHTTILTQLPGVVRLQSTLTLRNVKKNTALPV